MRRPVDLDFDVGRYVDRIRAFDGPRFEVVTETMVHDLPILSVRSRTPTAEKTLLVLAGVHGNELAGLLAVPSILERHVSSERVRLVVMTPVNPVGAAERKRHNATGHDINRDFVRFVTPEAQAVRKVYDEVRPDFVIALHEGPQDGTFMFANRFVDPKLASALCNALAAGGTLLAKKDYFGRRLPEPGLSPATATTRAVWRWWARAFRQQATIVYSQDRGVPELVLESSWWNTNQESRLRPHIDLVTAVSERL